MIKRLKQALAAAVSALLIASPQPASLALAADAAARVKTGPEGVRANVVGLAFTAPETFQAPGLVGSPLGDLKTAPPSLAAPVAATAGPGPVVRASRPESMAAPLPRVTSRPFSRPSSAEASVRGLAASEVKIAVGADPGDIVFDGAGRNRRTVDGSAVFGPAAAVRRAAARLSLVRSASAAASRAAVSLPAPQGARSRGILSRLSWAAALIVTLVLAACGPPSGHGGPSLSPRALPQQFPGFSPLISPGYYTGPIPAPGSEAVYRLSFDRGNFLSGRLDGVAGAELQLRLLNFAGVELARSPDPTFPGAPGVINFPVFAGTYFVAVGNVKGGLEGMPFYLRLSLQNSVDPSSFSGWAAPQSTGSESHSFDVLGRGILTVNLSGVPDTTFTVTLRGQASGSSGVPYGSVSFSTEVEPGTYTLDISYDNTSDFSRSYSVDLSFSP